MIFEQPSKVEQIPAAGTEVFEPVQTTKMAIVGMDTFFGLCNCLDAFERSIYDGTQHFITLPPDRWKGIEDQQQLLLGYGFEGGVPLGAYIKDFEIDTLHFKIPPNEVDKLSPQELLILRVADRALRDAGIGERENVTVIIAIETEVSVDQLLALWHFTGSSFILNAGENSTFKALEVAQMLLAAKEVDAVLVGAVDLAGEVENVLLRNQWAKINTGVNTLSYDKKTNGWMVGEGAGAVVLKRLDTAKQDQDRIYAVIDAISLVQECATSEKVNGFPQPPVAEAVTQACQKAFTDAGIKPVDVSYLEVFGSGVDQEDEAEIRGLTLAYQTPKPKLSCAIGSVKANIGHTYGASGIASLIKTALCLYHRYFPATPQWSGPKRPEAWQGSPFYVPTESRPWFLEEGSFKRVAAINGLGLDGTYAHLILSEESSQRDLSSRYLEQMPFYLFVIAADDRSALLEQIRALQQTIEDCSSLSAAASKTFAAFQKRSQAIYTLSILGHNKDELQREIQRAVKGVANAFDRGEDWQTPVGSYFTAKPLGKLGAISYVYPGAFNSYIGLGRNIFRLFPKIYDHADNLFANIGLGLREKLLYPRSLYKLSTRQLEVIEQQLMNDALALFESGIGFAAFLTTIMRDYFKVQPQYTFGYSLGETSMMCAQGIWTSCNQASDALNSSPLFKTRLSGSKNAVREYWGLPQGQENKGEFWSSYVLMSPASRVRESLKHENRVYLVLINTPEEVVIAGDAQACLRVIETLNCDAFRAPFNHVIHCEAMHSEYHELVKLNTLPVQNVLEIVCYSAAEYEPIKLDSHSIGHNIAKALCQPCDFPRLINRAYEDGARIFIEAGAGSICSRWIGETLKQKEHVTVSINRRGVDDHTSIVKALAKLVSHRVSLDLSPLYCPVKESFSQRKSIEMTYPKIQRPIMNIEENSTSIINNNFQTKEELEFNNGATKQGNKQYISVPNTATPRFIHKVDLNDLRKTHYQKLSTNTSRVTKAHAAFLQARQESLQQISEIIQLQTAFLEQLLNQESLVEINNKPSEEK